MLNRFGHVRLKKFSHRLNKCPNIKLKLIQTRNMKKFPKITGYDYNRTTKIQWNLPSVNFADLYRLYPEQSVSQSVISRNLPAVYFIVFSPQYKQVYKNVLQTIRKFFGTDHIIFYELPYYLSQFSFYPRISVGNGQSYTTAKIQ